MLIFLIQIRNFLAPLIPGCTGAQAAPGASGHHSLIPRPLGHGQPQSLRVNEDQGTDLELDEHQKLLQQGIKA